MRTFLKRYYFEHLSDIRPPTRISEREFGYSRDGSMVRHIRILDEAQMRVMLVENAPADVYCSNGYYLLPDQPMGKKDWKGADLIFDIDAKDLDLPCRPDHVIRICECGHKYLRRTECPECGSKKSKAVSVPCGTCIVAAWRDAARLCEILEKDIGLDDIETCFSGNEGFHISVDAMHGLGAKERMELADYLMFRGADTDNLNPDAGGWGARYAAHLASGGMAAGPVGVRLDPQVTADIHRIFRFPGSINSKSGLTKMPWDGTMDGNPYSHAAMLGNDIHKVLADCPVRFRLGDVGFGPFRNEEVELPAYAAAYLLCKGLASEIPG